MQGYTCLVIQVEKQYKDCMLTVKKIHHDVCHVRVLYACMLCSIGADITDYFNYGFTEDTWKQYCEKQRRLRMDLNMPKKTFVVCVKLFFLSVNNMYCNAMHSLSSKPYSKLHLYTIVIRPVRGIYDTIFMKQLHCSLGFMIMYFHRSIYYLIGRHFPVSFRFIILFKNLIPLNLCDSPICLRN
jgi:hypothetical protein